MLKSLTFKPPIAFCISHLGCTIAHVPPTAVEAICPGQYISIHSSLEKDWKDEEAVKYLQDRYKDPIPPAMFAGRHSAVVAVATVVRVDATHAGDSLEDKWRLPDQYAVVLKDVRQVLVLGVRGNRRMWSLPDDVEAKIKRIIRLE